MEPHSHPKARKGTHFWISTKFWHRLSALPTSPLKVSITSVYKWGTQTVTGKHIALNQTFMMQNEDWKLSPWSAKLLLRITNFTNSVQKAAVWARNPLIHHRHKKMISDLQWEKWPDPGAHCWSTHMKNTTHHHSPQAASWAITKNRNDQHRPETGANRSDRHYQQTQDNINARRQDFGATIITKSGWITATGK